MQHFYDGQIRRYTTQMMRILANFPVQDGKGVQKEVPVMYGDLTRQVANIIRENSENKLPSVPRISLYLTGLELDKDRLTDATYTRKTNIREREYDTVNKEYLNTQGKNYTVERLIPTPYMMRLNADIWTSNTDQKLQLLEQILVLFNPSLEMQTTDNFIDWTSISVVNLENVTWSSRSVPVGIDSDIDICTITFSIPIYISPPTKVRKMGVITNIITSMFDETLGTIEGGVSKPVLNAYDDVPRAGVTQNEHGRISQTDTATQMANVNYATWGAFLDGDAVQLYSNGMVGNKNWREIFEALPGMYAADVSRIFFTSQDNSSTVTGTFTISPFDEGKILMNWDIKTTGVRLLLLNDVGDATANFSPVAWQNTDTTATVASANDIIEWDGSKWNIVFDASTTTAVTYTTNLNTSVQYRFNNDEWLLSIDGDYPVGTWRIELAG